MPNTDSIEKEINEKITNSIQNNLRKKFKIQANSAKDKELAAKISKIVTDKTTGIDSIIAQFASKEIKSVQMEYAPMDANAIIKNKLQSAAEKFKVFDANPDTDELIKGMAKLFRKKFDALKNENFTDDQALQILLCEIGKR